MADFEALSAELKNISRMTHLKLQFDDVSGKLDQLRRSELFEMDEQTKIALMRLELDSLVKRAFRRAEEGSAGPKPQSPGSLADSQLAP